MRITERINQLRQTYQQQLRTLRLPEGLVHRFDTQAAAGPVEKTTSRRVITLDMVRFQAIQVHRHPATDGPSSPSTLDRVVPKGEAYGYDVIAHVGCETFLHGRQLEDLARELPHIPFSSLYDLQHKFLFYLGHFHRQSAPILTDWFGRHGRSTWLIDATIEPDTPMYFGIYEAQYALLLDAYRIPSESTEAITPCLQQTAIRFGTPGRILHDLSEAMSRACNQALPQTTHTVCHFHLLRDIGEDLYAMPQDRLRRRVRQLKLQSRLKDQRKGQTAWLRGQIENTSLLVDVLTGNQPEMSKETAGREVLVAFHQWLLDYPRDGHRQGFPFDPYLLYFHRRLVRASAAVERLLGDPQVEGQAPTVLKNFAHLLRQYLADRDVQEAAAQYEAAFTLFHRLRTVLHLGPQGHNPLRDRYLLAPSEAAELQLSLESFREECRQQSQVDTDAASRERYRLVWQHLERYWHQLFPSPEDPCQERTTNGLEACWGTAKRRCRQRHGRKKLTREFRSLPADFLLTSNLENPEYIDLLLDGKLENLAHKLAETGQTAGSWTKWRNAQHPLNHGRLPRRLIRQPDFLDQLTATYHAHCQGDAA